jgi:hypothetical protein
MLLPFVGGLYGKVTIRPQTNPEHQKIFPEAAILRRGFGSAGGDFSVLLLVPLDGPPETLLEADRDLIAEGFAGGVDIG